MHKFIKKHKKTSNKSLTIAKILRFLLIPFRPSLLQTYLVLDQFIDIPIDQLKKDGIQGVLVDADGTMGPHQARKFPQKVVEHVNKMVGNGLKVAIYTNACEDRFYQFQNIAVVTDVPPKPDRRGFKKAMKNFLGLDDPHVVCMVGDNFITDGGACSAGMRFIYICPVKGNEPFMYSFMRNLAFRCAKFYFPNSFA